MLCLRAQDGQRKSKSLHLLSTVCIYIYIYISHPCLFFGICCAREHKASQTPKTLPHRSLLCSTYAVLRTIISVFIAVSSVSKLVKDSQSYCEESEDIVIMGQSQARREQPEQLVQQPEQPEQAQHEEADLELSEQPEQAQREEADLELLEQPQQQAQRQEADPALVEQPEQQAQREEADPALAEQPEQAQPQREEADPALVEQPEQAREEADPALAEQPEQAQREEADPALAEQQAQQPEQAQQQEQEQALLAEAHPAVNELFADLNAGDAADDGVPAAPQAKARPRNRGTRGQGSRWRVALRLPTSHCERKRADPKMSFIAGLAT